MVDTMSNTFERKTSGNVIYLHFSVNQPIRSRLVKCVGKLKFQKFYE